MRIPDAIGKHCDRRKRYADYYESYGEEVPNGDGVLRYIDNGSDWLAVAHLDTVMFSKPKFGRYCVSNCPQLDDRLGVAIILELLHDYVGERPDILLCDLEEKGNTTAQHFVPPKDYRFGVEFDRAGSDAVFYQYEGGSLEDTFKWCGWDTGMGSFSDITDLNIGAECVNVGCGYHNQHSDRCFANYCEVESQLVRFAVWFDHFGKDDYPFKWKPQQRWYSYTPLYKPNGHSGGASVIPSTAPYGTDRETSYSYGDDYYDGLARDYGYRDLDDMILVEGLKDREQAQSMLLDEQIEAWQEYIKNEEDE